MAHEAFQRSFDLLTEETRNMHRAIVSLTEELAAIDWYQQRADACSDSQLKDVALHNKSEEIEHAAMLMEWIRRHNGQFNAMMRKYLFTEQPITGIDKSAETDGAAPSTADGGASSAWRDASWSLSTGRANDRTLPQTPAT